MSEIAIEMKDGIVELCGVRAWGETRQRWLERGARLAGISFRSAKSLFYAEDHEPRASTVEKVRRAVAVRKKEEVSLADTYAELHARIDRLEKRLGR